MATSGRVVGPIWAGLAMGYIQLEAPFVIAGVLMLMACLFFLLARRTLIGDLT
jgi:dipeptide/tripeptide permease